MALVEVSILETALSNTTNFHSECNWPPLSRQLLPTDPESWDKV